jgi:NADPH-dependent 2,4-dienoyl-CoA reductase/sulfur reductase-like enzyme
MPYRRPPLTKEVLSGKLTAAEIDMEQEAWLEDNRVDLIAGRAVSIAPGDRTVVLSGGRTLAYAHCLLAPGAEPLTLPVPGADRPWVHVVRTLADVQALLGRLGDDRPVAVIGSGFIGCEIAASLRLRGHPVSLVSDEPAPNAARLGSAVAERLRAWLAEDGIHLHLGAGVERIERAGSGCTVVTGRARIDAEVVVMATGVRPRLELAHAAGLRVEEGGIRTDAQMRTDAPGVFAAGDAARALHPTAGRALRVEHWGDALAQGKVAGTVAAGGDAEWSSVPGFWSTIGERNLKYAAWGDGFTEVHVSAEADGAFTAWYGREGTVVGVLTHRRDADLRQGQQLIAQGAPWPY